MGLNWRGKFMIELGEFIGDEFLVVRNSCTKKIGKATIIYTAEVLKG